MHRIMFGSCLRLPGSGVARKSVRRAMACEPLEDRYLLNGSPFAIGGDARVHPDDFRITVFAQNLDYPYSMQPLADGSLLVGISRPHGTSYFDSVGELLRLTDEDDDGVADGPGTVLFNGLPGTVTSVRQAGALIFVTSGQASTAISVLRAGPTPADPLSFVGSIHFAFPSPWEHISYASAVRENLDQPGDYDLFFNVGSRENFAQSTDQVSLSGLVNDSVNGDAIVKVTVHDTGTVPAFYGLQQIATGLRNAAGIAVQPGTGDLYFEDNGIDGLSDADEPTSADEINHIAAADIGTSVFNFGFPNDYIEYRTGRRIGSGGIPPLVAFQPFPDPLNGSESEGPAEIAFAPPGFPDGLNNGIFVGFHGRFNLGGLFNEENPVVYYDLGTGAYFHFIENDEPAIGHLDTMAVTQDALFLADVSSTGSMDYGAGSGVIYEIKAVSRQAAPPPNDQPAGETSMLLRDHAFATLASRPSSPEITDRDPLLQQDVPLLQAEHTGRRTPQDALLGLMAAKKVPLVLEPEKADELGILRLNELT